MTLSDNTGNNSASPLQENAGCHSSEFKSQLRADAQEFKPTLGISSTSNIPKSSIYYHGVTPNYSHMIEYDRYRASNTHHNKSHSKKQNNEPLKSSTHLNPNAQEFIPRSWVNQKEPVVNNLEPQKNRRSCADNYTRRSDKSDSQIHGHSASVTLEQNKHNSNESMKSWGDTKSPSNNADKTFIKTENLRSNWSKPNRSTESPVNSSPHRNDKSASNPASPIKHSNDASNQSIQFTFKDKLLARVGTPNSNTNDASLVATNHQCANISIENKQNLEMANSDSLKTAEVTATKETVHLNTAEKYIQNDLLDEKNQHSNKDIAINTSANDMSNKMKQIDSGPVSWAQRLKNSTSVLQNRKVNETCSFNIDPTLLSDGRLHVEKTFERQDLETLNPISASFSKLESHPESEFDANNTTKASERSRERYSSPESSKEESLKCGVLYEGQLQTKYLRVQECVDIQSPNINNSILTGGVGHVDQNKIVSDYECPKEEDTTSRNISLFESTSFPIFILLSLRSISTKFKYIDFSFSPPELCKRNLNSKEIERDNLSRIRSAWPTNLNHTNVNKHFHRDINSYAPNTRRDRFQGHNTNQAAQGNRRVNENVNKEGQNPTLDWTRDERKMFRLESSAESWVVKQKEQKVRGTQFETQLRQYRAILNKLTIEKFDKLYEQILSVGINNEEEMIGLLKLVFDKATTQHHFIPMYVELCDKLRDHLKDVTTIEIRRILVDLCQELFVENLSEMVLPEHIQNNEEDSFEWQLKYKNKMKGNMIFMASLVRKKVIASTVVLMCMEELLQFHLPHHLEALCVFLHHVGPFLDSDRWKHYDDFNTLFLQFEEFSNNIDIPIRIRFLINDVIDSRKNNWKSKNTKEGPMMLDDLKSKINAERGESGSTLNKSSSSQYKHQSGTSGTTDRINTTDSGTRSPESTPNPWQKRGVSSSSNESPINSNISNTSEKYLTTNCLSYGEPGYGNEDLEEMDDDEFLDEDNEHFIPEHIKESICGLMDSYVASYDLDEFFGHLNDLEIPPEYFDGVYKSIFVRIAEYKIRQRSELFKALVLYSLKNKEYMNGESAKAGIQMALQPCILDDILIDVPQFKEIVLAEFIADAVSKYDSSGQVFDSDFISQANLLLS
ncbi:eukaryotic translation initiation factor 4 gamma and Nic domain-containing protein [Cryptosporidium canis]|uniref:Eukaryotic translation initiation factor 4 gamma and Nic domain-containing protein n=1 Tax=Cryptosporidium canis TaxID=195482 RepID=A0ABQ8PB89_9CRYT|nr:eukaryotic translation initiation factor 4 gamma and Nic domain-containing protein [Cryptosporidium canis]KAJ1615232.1 eukaryotic translation initiation factor 4 gamma and Nic domain-containing protein [Cryptosporidium canis]